MKEIKKRSAQASSELQASTQNISSRCSYLPPVVMPVYRFHAKELRTAAASVPAVAPSGTPVTVCSPVKPRRSLISCNAERGFVLIGELRRCTILHKLSIQQPAGPVAACSTKIRPTFLTGNTKDPGNREVHVCFLCVCTHS